MGCKKRVRGWRKNLSLERKKKKGKEEKKIKSEHIQMVWCCIIRVDDSEKNRSMRIVAFSEGLMISVGVTEQRSM